MIRITDRISLDESELRFEFIRSSGPGGQNVNKVATAVRLRLDVAHSPSLPPDVRDRILRLGGKRVTDAGELIIDARRHRTQDRNRQDALERLADTIRAAAERPKPRHATRPSLGAKTRRLNQKRRRGSVKQLRKRETLSDE